MKRQMIRAVLMGVTFAMPLAASANLILNGGFENPAPSPVYQYRTGNQITDWTISSTHRGVVQFDFAYQPVGMANYSVQLEAGGPSPDSIWQTVSTMPGATYYVSFLFAAFEGSASSMNVTIDAFTGNYTSSSQAYASHVFSFVADDLFATLRFENGGAYGVSFPQIDSVTMEFAHAPEPTTVIVGALLLLPLGVSTIRFLRKSRVA